MQAVVLLCRQPGITHRFCVLFFMYHRPSPVSNPTRPRPITSHYVHTPVWLAADMRRVVSFTFYPEGYEWVEPSPTVLSEGHSGACWAGLASNSLHPCCAGTQGHAAPRTLCHVVHAMVICPLGLPLPACPSKTHPTAPPPCCRARARAAAAPRPLPPGAALCQPTLGGVYPQDPGVWRLAAQRKGGWGGVGWLQEALDSSTAGPSAQCCRTAEQSPPSHC